MQDKASTGIKLATPSQIEDKLRRICLDDLKRTESETKALFETSSISLNSTIPSTHASSNFISVQETDLENGSWEQIYDWLPALKREDIPPNTMEIFKSLPNFGTECQNYKAEFDLPVIRPEELEYKQWKNQDWDIYGSVKKSDGKPHGIVRMLWQGRICEFQYMDGFQHGLARFIDDKTYKIG